jgi:hypothetical protein
MLLKTLRATMDVVVVPLASTRRAVLLAKGQMDLMPPTVQQRTEDCVHFASRAAGGQPMALSVHVANVAMEVRTDMPQTAPQSALSVQLELGHSHIG